MGACFRSLSTENRLAIGKAWFRRPFVDLIPIVMNIGRRGFSGIPVVTIIILILSAKKEAIHYPE
jgi:hypothetical protein